MKPLISLVLLCVMRVGYGQEIKSTEYYSKAGIYYSLDSNLLNATVIDRWETERVKLSFTVVNGLIEGVCKNFYASGQLQSIKFFRSGKLTGVFTEYFSNGELKLQAEIGKQCREGGNEITKILYAYYDNAGTYITKVKSKARIVFLTEDNLSNFFNEQLDVSRYSGYRLFDNKLTDYGIFMDDSREVLSPAESNKVDMPVKRVK